MTSLRFYRLLTISIWPQQTFPVLLREQSPQKTPLCDLAAVQSASTHCLKDLSENGIHSLIQAWKTIYQKCADAKGF